MRRDEIKDGECGEVTDRQLTVDKGVKERGRRSGGVGVDLYTWILSIKGSRVYVNALV